MIKLIDVNVWYGKNHVLKNLNCSIESGDFIVIVGSNGAGKSSFFNTIAGTLKPTSGTITFNNEPITHLSEQQRAHYIARLFQSTSLSSVGCLTVHQNLALALLNRHSAGLRNGLSSLPLEKAEELVTSMGMPQIILKKLMKDLSGGQRQLISFVMATLQKPQLLLLDEPTAALDPQAATRLLRYAVHSIKQHAITTLLITHDPYLALALGNKIWILEQGMITHQFDEHEKKNLSPDQLVGHIDYDSFVYV